MKFFLKWVAANTLFLLLFYSNTTTAQVITLPNDCKFKMGDSMSWANQFYNDSDWEDKKLGASCLTPEMKGDVFVWIRIKFIIPSTIKELAIKENGIKLNLGKIDDVDQTYFNSNLIGQTGNFPPTYQGKWDVERKYIIPVHDVQWDKENIIAVRLFSPDIQGIGMYQGPYNFSPIQWSDFISVKQTISTASNNSFKTTFEFTSSYKASFDGLIKYFIENENGTELYTEVKQIKIEPAQNSKTVVQFSNYQPVNENMFTVGYYITDNNSSATLKNEQLYLSEKKIQIKILPEPKPIVQNKVKDLFVSTPFQNQQLNGYLNTRLKQNLIERLLKIDEEGILDGYLQRPGHHPWAGEHIGKYLETACNVWKNTHNTQLKMQMDRLVYLLIHSQKKDGYLGTYTPDEYWTSWDVWSHKYNLYGLLAYYTTTGYQPALEACKKIGNLMCATFGNKPHQKDIILAGTHVGMAATSILDPMVDLYIYTGEKKYLDFCYYILDAWEQNNGPKIISRLLATENVKDVGNGKAYEMISNFTGLVKLYRITADKKMLTPLLIAWKSIANNKLYITGTTSSMEYFQKDSKLPAEINDHIGEGCVTTSWIQFNKELLSITGEVKYLEQIEKSVYNHLLAAENPQTGCVSYYTPLMGAKPYTCYITCCQSSVPRGIALIPSFTTGYVKNILTLLLYEPASYHQTIVVAGNKIRLSINVETNFPETGEATISIKTSQSALFPIALRVPSWCTTFSATVGNITYTGYSNQYLTINRLWKSDEKIKVSFKMPIQIISGANNYPNQIAYKRGPQVLAFDDSLNNNFLKTHNLEATTLLDVERNLNKVDESILPKYWIGKQAYSIQLSTDKKNTPSQYIIMVPFADASQTNGAIKVWLPLHIYKKNNND